MIFFSFFKNIKIEENRNIIIELILLITIIFLNPQNYNSIFINLINIKIWLCEMIFLFFIIILIKIIK